MYRRKLYFYLIIVKKGQIGRISLFYRNYCNIWGFDRKFAITEYFFRFKNNTKRKYQRFTNGSFLNKIKDYYLDVKYYWSQKKTKGISIICDRDKGLIYTLVETSLKNQYNLNRVENQSHRELRIYDVSDEHQMNIFSKMQAKIYNNPPHLLFELTQQKLYNQIGAHLFNNMNLQKFQIAGIHIPKNYFSSYSPYQSHISTVLIMLANGSRLFLSFNHGKIQLSQLKNMPNLEQVLQFNMTNQAKNDRNVTSCTISQKQQTNFKLISYKFNQCDNSLAIIGLYKRSIIALVFTKSLGQNQLVNNCQQVQLLWEESLDYDSRGQLSGSIFINYSDYKIYSTPQFQTNIYKQKLTQYRKNQTLFDNQSNRKQKRAILNPSRPQSYQVLHYPSQFLFITKDKVKGITKLRPVDILLDNLQKQINSHTKNNFGSNISSIMLSDYQLSKLLQKLTKNIFLDNQQKDRYNNNNKLQILQMLIQIYCDVDGIYYFQKYNNTMRINATVKRQPPQNQYLNLNSKTQSTRMANNTLIDQQRRKRLTQKYKKQDKFNKYRHSDLYTTQNKYYSRQQNRSPIKIRSDYSIIKLIQKLIIHTINRNKQYSKQNKWIHPKLQPRERQAITSELQQGVLLYLSRLIAYIWHTKILHIKTVYPFLTQILKKLLQLLHHICQQLTISTSNIPQSVIQLISFCTSMVEYNKMLNVLTIPIQHTYGEGINMDKDKFQQFIFYSIVKQKDRVNLLNQWRNMFNSYFGLRLYKAIKLHAQIAGIPKQSQRKQVIIKNINMMPYYLLANYCRDGTITTKQYNQLIKIYQNVGNTNMICLKNNNHLLLTNSMDPYQKVQYAIGQLTKNTRNLQQKQFLINYALQNVANIRTLSDKQLQKKKIQIKQIQKIIKIQQIIYKYLKNYQKQYPNQVLNQQTKYLINYILLTPTKLKALVKQLKNPMIQLISACCFWDTSTNIQQILRQLIVNTKNQIISSHQMQEKLMEIFRIMSGNIARIIPATTILPILDSIAYKQIQFQDLTIFIHRNDQKYIKKICWVPLFLSQYGWSQLMILDHYIQQAKKYYIPIALPTQKQFMYYWLCGYTLVKYRYLQGRRNYQISNQSIFKVDNNTQNDYKFLIQFARNNLTY